MDRWLSAGGFRSTGAGARNERGHGYEGVELYQMQNRFLEAGSR